MLGLAFVPAFIALVATPAAPSGEAFPRVVLTLAVIDADGLQLTVESAAPRPTSLAGVAYLVLTRGRYDSERRYWAKLETGVTPSKNRPVQLAGHARLSSAIRPGELAWAEDRSGLGPEQPLGRVVPPGAYRLQVQVQAPDDSWWRSNEVQVEVVTAGSFKYR